MPPKQDTIISDLDKLKKIWVTLLGLALMEIGSINFYRRFHFQSIFAYGAIGGIFGSTALAAVTLQLENNKKAGQLLALGSAVGASAATYFLKYPMRGAALVHTGCLLIGIDTVNELWKRRRVPTENL